MGLDFTELNTMNSLSFLMNRTKQLEPADLYPSNDMTQIESDTSIQSNLHRHFPHLLSERQLDIGHCDKVFTSAWLNEDLFLIGTKSNQVCEHNVLYLEDLTAKLHDHTHIIIA